MVHKQIHHISCSKLTSWDSENMDKTFFSRRGLGRSLKNLGLTKPKTMTYDVILCKHWFNDFWWNDSDFKIKSIDTNLMYTKYDAGWGEDELIKESIVCFIQSGMIIMPLPRSQSRANETAATTSPMPQGTMGESETKLIRQQLTYGIYVAFRQLWQLRAHISGRHH